MDLMKLVVNDGEGCLWFKQVPCGLAPDTCWEIMMHHPDLEQPNRYTGHAGDMYNAYWFHVSDYGKYFNGGN